MNQRDSRSSNSATGREARIKSARRRLWRIFHRKNVLLITDLKRSPGQDLRHRKRMYNVLQGLRVPFLLLAGASFLWWHNWFLSTVFIVASVPLSWIAVVIANGHGQPRDPRTPQVYKPGLVREMNKRAALEAQKATELQEDDREGAGKMELYQDPLDFSGIVIDAEEPKEKRIDES